ncbi:LCI fold-containing protein [Bacillus sp. BK450]|uniref:LCI fold-containing protein n=1 Tax=Bacillus sp. BK450 TaxID=2512182 RepID=UPI0010E5A2B7|nr:LCI fold-containing protein [Bacillus sp. BK450]TDU13401.1 antimicrobial protein lci [Bacillus sp. BK450]
MNWKKTMTGVALSFGLLLSSYVPAANATSSSPAKSSDGVARTSNFETPCPADILRKFRNSDKPFLCMYSDTAIFANSFTAYGMKWYFKGSSGLYAYYEGTI